MRAYSLLAVALVVAVSGLACNDETTGPGNGNFTPFSPADQAALINAVQSVAPLEENGIAGFADLVVDQLEFTGTAGDFDAFGMEIIFDITTAEAQFTGASGAIFGWSGLATNSVAAVITAGGIILNAPSFTGSVTIGDTGSQTQFGFGGYYSSSTMSSYDAVSGTFTVSSSSFSGTPIDCSETVEGTLVPCTAVAGEMSGSFAFEADRDSGTGPSTYTQPTTPFTLPAVRVTITIEP